ncbi:MAG: hypothetical protein WC805_00035 [Patescibacteria group bacterium]|jgi:hypothetical protein
MWVYHNQLSQQEVDLIRRAFTEIVNVYDGKITKFEPLSQPMRCFLADGSGLERREWLEWIYQISAITKKGEIDLSNRGPWVTAPVDEDLAIRIAWGLAYDVWQKFDSPNMETPLAHRLWGVQV